VLHGNGLAFTLCSAHPLSTKIDAHEATTPHRANQFGEC
jgi:hypothetical protein